MSEHLFYVIDIYKIIYNLLFFIYIQDFRLELYKLNYLI